MNSAKPTKIEKLQKQFVTRLKKVEKLLPEAWEISTRCGMTPEAMVVAPTVKSNWLELTNEERYTVYDYNSGLSDLRRTVSDLDRAFAAEAKRAASALKREAKAAAEDGLRMTCQVCGRKIQANTGAIAHHGYERPSIGWQTSSCDGARHLPLEASTTVLDIHISQQARALGGMEVALKNLIDETSPIFVTLTEGYGKSRKDYRLPLTRENFDAVRAENARGFLRRGFTSFESVKVRAMNKQEKMIMAQTEYLVYQKGRLMKAIQLGPTHRFNDETKIWEKI